MPKMWGGGGIDNTEVELGLVKEIRSFKSLQKIVLASNLSIMWPLGLFCSAPIV